MTTYHVLHAPLLLKSHNLQDHPKPRSLSQAVHEHHLLSTPCSPDQQSYSATCYLLRTEAATSLTIDKAGAAPARIGHFAHSSAT
jgi:hypothetical protein